MIFIDNTKTLEKATADKPFVCCFLHDDNSYMCFVHQVEPKKKLYQIIITAVNESHEQTREIEEYNLYMHTLDSICRTKKPNSKEFRVMTSNLIPVEWKLVDSSRFVNEDFNSYIRKFLLDRFRATICEIVSNQEDLSEIDGDAEIID